MSLHDLQMYKQFLTVRYIGAILLSIFVAGCGSIGDISRYEGAAPPMDSGMGINADVKTFCTFAGLVAFKVRMHEEHWRLATSGKFHFPESRVRLLVETYELLRESIDKGERTHQEQETSSICRAVSTRKDLRLTKHPRLCTTLGLLEAKLGVYEITWRSTTASEFRQFPEERVKLLFDADVILRKKLSEMEREHRTLKNSARCQG